MADSGFFDLGRRKVGGGHSAFGPIAVCSISLVIARRPEGPTRQSMARSRAASTWIASSLRSSQ